jgi:glyoxylase-like metal-dependent hydrolase (beta-lactamase superfamily II)
MATPDPVMPSGLPSIRVGDIRITLISDGRFRLDGGAMFGVVPRVVWEKRSPADEAHRIQLAFNAMLVDTGTVRIVVDPGLGTRYDASFARRFAVEQPPRVGDSLRAAGVEPESVDFVVDTHLHWDHAGANTAYRAADGSGTDDAIVPTFPNAQYVVQRREWEAAMHPHDRNRASYRAEDFVPLERAGRLMLVDGAREIVPGVRVMPVGGHSDGMQLLRADSGGRTFVHLADLVPTRHHLDYPWVMGYDLYPVETLRQKQALLPEAAADAWLVGFVHDPDLPFARIGYDGGRPVALPA